jgi:hypothetical protein
MRTFLFTRPTRINNKNANWSWVSHKNMCKIKSNITYNKLICNIQKDQTKCFFDEKIKIVHKLD